MPKKVIGRFLGELVGIKLEPDGGIQEYRPGGLGKSGQESLRTSTMVAVSSPEPMRARIPLLGVICGTGATGSAPEY